MASPPTNQSRIRPIVVVDDDPLLCEFVSMALNEEGYRTLTASDGIQALSIVQHERPAMVLMDVGIPLLNGRDLAHRVRATCGVRVPCVLMSGGNPDPKQDDEDAVAGYLRKPFELDDLLALVHRFAVETNPYLTP